MAPEGIENNEVLYELITDAGWTDKPIDVTEWYTNYTKNRYGKTADKLDSYWQGLQKSVYGTLVDNPRYNWQYRPGTMYTGNVNINDDFYKAVEEFAATAPQLKESPLYEADLIENTVHYIGAKMEVLVKNWETEFSNNNMKGALAIEKEFEQLALTADRLLLSHPTMKLENWLSRAQSYAGGNKELKSYYDHNARRIITVWVKPPLDDYAARIWSGLIRDYYLPRWQQYFESKRSDKYVDLAKWEVSWVESPKGLSKAKPFANPVQTCLDVLAHASKIRPIPSADGSQRLGGWSPADFRGGETAELLWNIPAAKAKVLKEVHLRQTRGDSPADLDKLVLEMDGLSYNESSRTIAEDGTIICAFNVPESATGNNSCRLRALVSRKGDSKSHGMISIVAD